MKQKTYAVLQIGSGSLHVLVARKGMNGNYVVTGEGRVEYEGYYDGVFNAPAGLGAPIAAAVHEAERQTREPITTLYVGVPTDFCRVVSTEASIAFPRAKRVRIEDVDELFALAEDKIDRTGLILINRAPIWFVADGDRRVSELEGEKVSKAGIKASFVYAEKSFVEQISAVLGSIGIGNVRYLSTALAELHYLFTEEQKLRPVMLVDVGSGHTSIAIGQGNGVVAMSSFASGGALIDADLAMCMHVNFEEARRIRHQVVLSLDVDADDKYFVERNGNKRGYSAIDVNTIIADRLFEMADIINRCIRVNSELITDTDEIYLTGEGILDIHGARDCFAKAIDRNVRAVWPRQPLLDKPQLAQVLSLVHLASEIDAE